LIEGCRSGEVSVLRRSENGKFKIETIERSLVGSSREEIFSIVFEIENKNITLLRYQEIAQYKNSYKVELKKLSDINKAELTTTQAKRIKELEETIYQIEAISESKEKQVNLNIRIFDDILEIQNKSIKDSTENEESENKRSK
jgi:hypothetical protein